MSLAELDKVARIFWLGLGSNETATRCSREVAIKLKHSYPKYFRNQRTEVSDSKSAAGPEDQELIRLCQACFERNWSRVHGEESQSQAHTENDSEDFIEVPPGVSVQHFVGPWFRYLKMAPMDEAVVLLYSSFLGFSDEVIAEALDTTSGTVRYRLGRAHRQLGIVLSEVPESAGAE